LLIIGTVGCSSVPSEISSAEHLEIGYYSFRANEATYLIVSEDDPKYADVSTTPRTLDQIDIKRAPDGLIRELVDYAATQDFFDRAVPGGPADLVQPATKAIITVRADGKEHSIDLTPPLTTQAQADAALAFSKLSREMATAFGNIGGTQYVDAGQTGGNIFAEQQKRLIESNSKAQRGGGGR